MPAGLAESAEAVVDVGAHHQPPGARIALHTVRGRVDVAWRRQGNSLVLDLRVPVNAVAEVLLPGGSATSSGQAPTGWTGSGGVGYRSCGATSPAIVGRRPG